MQRKELIGAAADYAELKRELDDNMQVLKDIENKVKTQQVILSLSPNNRISLSLLSRAHLLPLPLAPARSLSRSLSLSPSAYLFPPYLFPPSLFSKLPFGKVAAFAGTLQSYQSIVHCAAPTVHIAIYLFCPL